MPCPKELIAAARDAAAAAASHEEKRKAAMRELQAIAQAKAVQKELEDFQRAVALRDRNSEAHGLRQEVARCNEELDALKQQAAADKQKAEESTAATQALRAQAAVAEEASASMADQVKAAREEVVKVQSEADRLKEASQVQNACDSGAAAC